MRDIVDTSSQVRVKSKYRNFNEFMKNTGKDDFSSASSTDSGYSEGAGVVADRPGFTSYKKFLDSYGKKEFRSVAPPVSEKKSVKSEVFITINEPAPEVNLVVHVNKTSGGVKPEILQKPVLHVSAAVPSPPAMPPPTFSSKPPQQNNRQKTHDYKPTQYNTHENTSPAHTIKAKITHDKDHLEIMKNSVIEEIRKSGENGFPKQKNKSQYVPQNSYQFTKMFSDKPSPVTNTLPRSWKSDANAKLGNVEADPITRIPVTRDSTTINKNDPNVNKMVYGTYRGLLSAYNKPANNFVSTLPRNMVIQDKGVTDQLNSIQSGPPPADRRGEPPPCVQNAMMTKDKKPFTYTPGGIDLSEIKSPRMVRRMERNLNSPGVVDMPKSPLAGAAPALPPSAVAAMQPGPVQVFPVGAPPPPPPPPANVPPPPPMQKVPTKPVATSDGVFERPDMTRIIPENPMALLRKTPKVERKSFLDELKDVPASQRTPPATNQQPHYSPQPQYAPQSPQYSPQPQVYSPQPQQYSPQPQQQYSPQPQQQYSPQPQQQYSPQAQQYSPQYSPQPQYNPQPKYNPQSQFSPQPQFNAQPQPYSPQNQNNQYKQVANQNNAPQMVSSPEPVMQQPQMKTSNVNIGSLYIPPINQREKNETPPTPPQRQAESQSPQSPIPKLNAAPKPWQNQKKEQEVPQWAQRNQQPSSPQEKPPPQATISVRPPPMGTPAPIQPRQMVTPVQMQPPPSRPDINAVYVTQPEVYQHPGPGPNNFWVPPQVQNHPAPPSPAPAPQRQMPQETKGTRIIPIQIEGAGQPAPKTPGSDSQFNRQQSWTPNQSNSFKVLQKMTSTEGNDDYQDSPMVEHGPRSSQQYPQSPADQMRKMNLNEGEKEFMNRVKQGVDEGAFLHNEVDPRYRGPAIPSKAFRLLQTMTDQPSSPGNQSGQIRTIPVQVEGNGSAQPYVHPSQQTVPEPKKYTGSAIPSKAFKMVQAMTSNALADGNQTSESNHPSSYQPWMYDNYPAPPYWEDYYSYYYPNIPNPEIDSNNARKTPVPHWQYYPTTTPTPCQQSEKNEQTDEESDSEPKMCSSCRNTPVPFWGYPYPYYPNPGYDVPPSEKESGEANDSKPCSRQPTPSSFDQYQYVPYWDPYYYSYYYGYPPMYPVPYYPEYDGYSSTEEMNYYAGQYHQGMPNQNPESETEKEDEAPTPVPENLKEVDNSDNVSEATIKDTDADTDTSDSESGDDIYKSATSMNTQSTENPNDNDRDEDVEYDDNETASENADDDDDEDDYESVYINDDTIPHVLSVIFEESDRSESVMLDRSRESSVATSVSDDTVILDSNEAEEPEGEEEVVSVKLPLKLKFSISNGNKEITEVTVGNSEVNSFSWHGSDEPTSEYTIKSPIPKQLMSEDDSDKQNEPDEEVNDSEEVATSENAQSPEPEESGVVETTSADNEEEEEIDFWSQINKDEDTLPKRNKFFNSYRNTTYSIDRNDEYESNSTKEEIGNTEVALTEKDNAFAIEKLTTNESNKVAIICDKDGNKGNEIINVKVKESQSTSYENEGNTIHLNSDVVRNTEEQRITSIKNGDIENTIDVVSNTTEDVSSKAAIIENEDSIEKVCVENFKISNLVFEREELKQTLNPPTFDLGLDKCFKSLKSNFKMPEFEDTVYEHVDNKYNPGLLNRNNYVKDESNVVFESTPADTNKKRNSIPTPNEDAHDMKCNATEFFNKNIEEDADLNITCNNSTDQKNSKKKLGNKVNSKSENDESKTIKKPEGENISTLPIFNQTDDDGLTIAKRKISSSDSKPAEECALTKQNTNDKNIISSKSFEKLLEDELDKEISDLNNNTQQDFYVPTIKERIRALENASRNMKKKRLVKEHKEIEVRNEECLDNKSNKSNKSTKSIEDISEDDIDSGVTSDMSRHISDTESEFTELRKLNKYQRAATHSRLFKLLQGICDGCDDEDMEVDHLEQYNEVMMRKESLSLPLTANFSDYDSIPSSSVNSPSSPVSDKLVNELVLSLLKKKKGQKLRNIPMKTLQAAAHKILQEEKCLNAQDSSSDVTTAHTPQEFYTDAEYQQYYDSFETYDILPSKTFKSLHNKTETSGFAAKCPRVTSSKNLHKELSDLTESTDTPTSTPVPDTSLHTQEAMSTS